MDCYCGSKKNYSECCEPYLKGEKKAPTPEALMRSRYSAFVQNKEEYILATMRGEALKDHQTSESDNDEKIQWVNLKIVNAPAVSPEINVGVVEFIATYQIDGRTGYLHEISEFHRVNDQWFYVDGKFPKKNTKPATKAVNVGRNDPCLCGSGKKYKKCCGG